MNGPSSKGKRSYKPENKVLNAGEACTWDGGDVRWTSPVNCLRNARGLFESHQSKITNHERKQLRRPLKLSCLAAEDFIELFTVTW